MVVGLPPVLNNRLKDKPIEIVDLGYSDKRSP